MKYNKIGAYLTLIPFSGLYDTIKQDNYSVKTFARGCAVGIILPVSPLYGLASGIVSIIDSNPTDKITLNDKDVENNVVNRFIGGFFIGMFIPISILYGDKINIKIKK